MIRGDGPVMQIQRKIFDGWVDDKLGWMGVLVESKHPVYPRLALAAVCGSNIDFALTSAMHGTNF